MGNIFQDAFLLGMDLRKLFEKIKKCFATKAQLDEHSADNREALGSNPSSRTIKEFDDYGFYTTEFMHSK